MIFIQRENCSAITIARNMPDSSNKLMWENVFLWVLNQKKKTADSYTILYTHNIKGYNRCVYRRLLKLKYMITKVARITN